LSISSIERIRWIAVVAVIFIISLVVLIFTVIMVVPLRSNVFAAIPLDNMIKTLPSKMQEWIANHFDLVGISSSRTSSMSNMMMTMMNQIPQDVMIKVNSSQVIPVGKESEIVLSISDKKTGKPLTDVQVIVGIERGTAMSTMDMVGPMFNAEEESGNNNKTSGLYIVKFTPNNEGYYTMHVHVIPFGESMSSMMENHLDIGVIAK
jgi:hypothetical protein